METKEILNSLYAIRAGLSVIAKNIDSFYDDKLQWLKDIYNIADDPTLDYWTKYEFRVNEGANVKELPSDNAIIRQTKQALGYGSPREYEWNNTKKWYIQMGFFCAKYIRQNDLYFNGKSLYDEFSQSNKWDLLLDYQKLEQYINRMILEKCYIDFDIIKTKYKQGASETDTAYKDRVIKCEIYQATNDFINNNFPKNRVWSSNFSAFSFLCEPNLKADKERMTNFFTFAHWLNTDECKKYLDERENFYLSKKKGFISKKIKYPVYLKIVQDAKAKLPELIEKVKAADKKYTEMTEWIMPMCKKIYNALVVNYSELLDVRDWKYLDLVIFAIETRRADSIKEALVFVDGEVRTERITSTIENAAKQICETISISMAALQNTMVNCCNSINAHITAVGGELSAKLDRAISATEMSNALLAKSNISSERLLNQVTSIKEIMQ